jgi:hypothetical protein
MRLIERYVIRIANFADRDTVPRLLDASAEIRGVVGTHLILELIRRLRNDACPVAWAGSGFTDSELSRDELTNGAYSTAVTYCVRNTAAVVEAMNVEGLRSWLEETLAQITKDGDGASRLFVPGLWPLADWTLYSVMGVIPVDRGDGPSCQGSDGSNGEAAVLHAWGAVAFNGLDWWRENVKLIKTIVMASSRISRYRLSTCTKGCCGATSFHMFSRRRELTTPAGIVTFASPVQLRQPLVLRCDGDALIAFRGVGGGAKDGWWKVTPAVKHVEFAGVELSFAGNGIFESCSTLAAVTARLPVRYV